MPIAYEFSIINGSDPPTEWSLLGSNDSKTWTELNYIKFTDENATDFCSFATWDRVYPNRCGENVTRRFYFENNMIFNSFKFVMYNDRLKWSEPSRSYYLRMFGFEFYGYYLYDADLYDYECTYADTPLINTRVFSMLCAVLIIM